ncbi:hypothetical protein BDB01DRAFT_853248 [Pilobolus umbonatus]|nr:hypothetical protein BDB01DRAFT_853248 [Pilobolus umbonatus]
MSFQVNFNKHGKELNEAYQSVLLNKDGINWLIFAYDKGSYDLRVQATGDGGLEELEEEFSDGKVQFAYARVIDPNSELPKFVFIGWCGNGVPETRKGFFNSHLMDVSRFFKSFHVQINARDEADVDPELIMKRVSESSGANYSFHKETSKPQSRVTPVNSVYKKTEIPDIAAMQRESMKKENAPKPVGTNYTPIQTAPRKLEQRWNVSQSSGASSVRAEREKFEKEVLEREKQSTKLGDRNTSRVDEEKRAEEQRRQEENKRMEERKREEERRRRQQQEDHERQQQEEYERQQQEDYERQQQEEYERQQQEDHERQQQEEYERQQQEDYERQRQEQQRDEQQRQEQQRQEQQRQEQQRQEQQRKRQEEERQEQQRKRQEEERKQQEREEAKHQEELKRQQEEERKQREHVEQQKRDESMLKSQLNDTADRAVHASQAAGAAAAGPADNHGVCAVVLFGYDASEANEMSLVEGELIVDIDTVDEGWWFGFSEDGKKQGLFPANYVELLAAQESSPPPPPKQEEHIAVALYDYDAEEDNEITFKEGQTITQIEFVNDDWWQGVSPDGKTCGLFPANYVELKQ